MSVKVALPGATLTRLHEAIHDVYRASCHEEFIDRAIAQLRALIPSEYVSYNELGRRPEQTLARLWPAEAAQPHVLATWARLAHQSPLLRYYQRTKDGSPRRLSDVISTANLRELPLWQELYRSLRVNYQLACALPAPQPFVIGIAASRTSRDYSDAELASLAVLRPHLIQAHDRTLELDRLRTRLNALESTLRAAGEAVILIPTAGARSLEGVGASDILTRWLSATTHTRSHITDWMRAERQRLHPEASELPTLGTPLMVTTERGSLTATYVHHITDELDAAVLRESPGAAIHTTTLTATSLGLTPRQAQIAALAAGGNTNERTSQLLEISGATVKKHLENAYARLGVKNRAELTALLLHTAVTIVSNSTPDPTRPSSAVDSDAQEQPIDQQKLRRGSPCHSPIADTPRHGPPQVPQPQRRLGLRP
jgi:DNA-binding CsgD family transcriptional regulator